MGHMPRRICAILAHPDDEVFIAGALCRHLEQGDRVTGIWLTSGDARGGRRRREAELARAMELLGLPPQHVRLPRFPNRSLYQLAPEARQWLAKTLATLRPDRIYVPAYEGGHFEHDLANCLVHGAWQDSCPEARCLEFPLYNRTGPWHLRGWRVNAFPYCRQDQEQTPLLPAHVRCKFAMMRCYASQWMDMLPFRLAMPAGRYLLHGEPLAPLPADRDYSMPPHPGELNYERNPGTQRFADFAAAVARLRVPAS